ncbi:sugar transferase [Rhodopila sp.]|jgi:exopolysaccharide biosynthesis polyprenyl glycosylphosphotransferase|uniref:sugar transferase n=1 Tax=Rhodopila sp. TaxID=2480087 RepID=UPI002BD8002A|nr:sugar transferase [Rhodopila sp.]HVZ08120.1 sugar transferase [Rhodopila sp.]
MFVSKSPEFRHPELRHLAFTNGHPTFAPISVSTPVTWRGASWRPLARGLKRVFDLAASAGILLVFSPALLAIALLIRLESPGPAFFRQERIGLHGRRFRMWKFRTMYHQAERGAALRQATRHDPRVTRIGGFLRRTSLDEIPQCINVLLGDMSVVGPRPHAPGTCAGGRPFEHITHRYADRHCVKPGMTGLAQVRGWRGETDTEEKLLRRLESDLEYIESWNPLVDLKIVGRTIWAVLAARNAY